MTDLIDLTKKSGSASSRGKKTMTKKTKKTVKTKSTKRVRRAYSLETITSAVKKAFEDWKKGTSLQALADRLYDGERNPLWIQFRMLAGGKEETLHRLRAKGAGMARGALRFAPTSTASARTAITKPSKTKGTAKGKKGKTAKGK
jgi:hypothetical protein